MQMSHKNSGMPTVFCCVVWWLLHTSLNVCFFFNCVEQFYILFIFWLNFRFLATNCEPVSNKHRTSQTHMNVCVICLRTYVLWAVFYSCFSVYKVIITLCLRLSWRTYLCKHVRFQLRILSNEKSLIVIIIVHTDL